MARHSGGFAISTYIQDLVEANAADSAHRSGQARRDGLVTGTGGITQKGWRVLNKDVQKLELNSMEWLRKIFENARDEGHSGDDKALVGTFWFDTSNKNQVDLIELGINEHIDINDVSYGDFWKGVSDFGRSVLGGAINFFDIDADVMKEIERAS
jgi:hypothetical protein